MSVVECFINRGIPFCCLPNDKWSLYLCGTLTTKKSVFSWFFVTWIESQQGLSDLPDGESRLMHSLLLSAWFRFWFLWRFWQKRHHGFFFFVVRTRKKRELSLLPASVNSLSGFQQKTALFRIFWGGGGFLDFLHEFSHMGCDVTSRLCCTDRTLYLMCHTILSLHELRCSMLRQRAQEKIPTKHLYANVLWRCTDSSVSGNMLGSSWLLLSRWPETGFAHRGRIGQKCASRCWWWSHMTGWLGRRLTRAGCTRIDLLRSVRCLEHGPRKQGYGVCGMRRVPRILHDNCTVKWVRMCTYPRWLLAECLFGLLCQIPIRWVVFSDKNGVHWNGDS